MVVASSPAKACGFRGPSVCLPSGTRLRTAQMARSHVHGTLYSNRDWEGAGFRGSSSPTLVISDR